MTHKAQPTLEDRAPSRAEIAAAVAAELLERAGKGDPYAVGLAVADRLSAVAPASNALCGSWLFVRQIRWVPPEVAARFDGVIVAVRNDQGRPINRDASWWAEVRAAGVEIVGFDWLVEPGIWRAGLAKTVTWIADNGGRGLCLNAEPRPAKHTARWEGKAGEAHVYASEARDLCDRRRLELWFSSWARPSARESFPWLEFIRAAHVCIPQPYEVHGATGPGYVADVLEEWRERGARRILLGRGAHELDKSDDDAWRTAREIRAHRESTPPGYGEAWWVPAGDIARRSAEVEAMTVQSWRAVDAMRG